MSGILDGLFVKAYNQGMNESFNPQLLELLFHQLGFSEKEVIVYRVLLEKGEAGAGEIIKKSGLKRGITYAVLYNLSDKKLIRTFEKRGKTYFQVESPLRIMEMVEKRKQELAAIDANMKHVIPQLVSQYKLAVGKPTIQYFEGEEGLLKVFDDIYAPKEDIVYGMADLDSIDEVFPKHIDKQLVPDRIKNKVTAYSFFPKSPLSEELHNNDEKQLRKSVLVNREEYPMPAEIDIYQDKIAMMSFTKGEFIGLLIENKDFAQTLRTLFRLAFDKLSK